MTDQEFIAAAIKALDTLAYKDEDGHWYPGIREAACVDDLADVLEEAVKRGNTDSGTEVRWGWHCGNCTMEWFSEDEDEARRSGLLVGDCEKGGRPCKKCGTWCCVHCLAHHEESCNGRCTRCGSDLSSRVTPV